MTEEFSCDIEVEVESQLRKRFEAALLEQERQLQAEEQERFESDLIELERQFQVEEQEKQLQAEEQERFEAYLTDMFYMTQEFSCDSQVEMERQLQKRFEVALLEQERQFQVEEQERFESALIELERQLQAIEQERQLQAEEQERFEAYLIDMFYSPKEKIEPKSAASTSKVSPEEKVEPKSAASTSKDSPEEKIEPKSAASTSKVSPEEKVEPKSAASTSKDSREEKVEPKSAASTSKGVTDKKSKAEPECAACTCKGKKTLQDFKELYLNQEDCDVIINVKGHKFPAHRNILKARSPVFASTFRHASRKERSAGILDVEDCDPSSFSDFLCFLYCGNLENLSMENVFGLFTNADKFDVQDLRMKCLEFMGNNLSVDTFCDIMTLAFQHSEKELIEIGIDFYKKNLLEIFVTVKYPSFLSICLSNAVYGSTISTIKALVNKK